MNTGKLKTILSVIILGGMGIIVPTLPSEAAEKVILKYSILRESVSVAELSTLAKTGEVSRSLQAYLKMANKEPQDLRNVLNARVDVDPILLSKILNSFPGEFLLDQVSEVIHTPSQRASRESLRGAMVTSALPDGNIRLIEVLENYPTPEIQVEGDRLVEIYHKIKGAVGGLSRLGL
jgi:hypothetical protein